MYQKTRGSIILNMAVAAAVLIMLLAAFAVMPQSRTYAAKEATAKTTETKVKVKVSGVTKPFRLRTGQSFVLAGTVKCNENMIRVDIGIVGSDGKWKTVYRAKPNAKTFDIAEADRYIVFGNLRSGEYRYRINVLAGSKREKFTPVDRYFKVLPHKVVSKLLKKPTTGEKVRIVGTFNTSNCKKLFPVRGYNNATVPQGMTFTGSKYYLIYGMDAEQAVVTYSASGKRRGAVTLPDNIGHPNGIGWNPRTKRCYIFKGYQLSCYSWKPDTDKFKEVDTPYSSSGVAYDKSTGKMAASSRTHIRIYTADGKFRQLAEFERCKRSDTHYSQDCGAARGFVFHAVSGENKHSQNYLDVYRVRDRKYLGTIRVNIDELESVIIDNEGFVQFLCNNTTRTDYIWKTPLNVYDLGK